MPLVRPDRSRQPRRNAVLVAAPSLTDPNFARTVVWLQEVGEEGVLGFVLNRPMGHTLEESALVDGPWLSVFSRIPLFYGGPVQPQQCLIAAFARGRGRDTIRCRLDADLGQIEKPLEAGRVWLRAFVGYAGWGRGQLEQEIAAGAWTVQPATRGLFMDHFLAGLWVVMESGDPRWRNLLDVIPPDPTGN